MNINSLRALGLAAALMWSAAALGASAEAIDRDVDDALEVFMEEINGAEIFLDQAAGYLVFPRVIKVGVGIGAETGEGALRVGDTTVEYYRTTGGSFGLQLGAQAKSVVIAFLTEEALDDFRNSNGWRVGIDGSVAIIDMGAGKTIDSSNVRDPVVGFIFGSRGLMYNLTLEGSRITRINRD